MYFALKLKTLGTVPSSIADNANGDIQVSANNLEMGCGNARK
jgi:hypothetical protein